MQHPRSGSVSEHHRGWTSPSCMRWGSCINAEAGASLSGGIVSLLLLAAVTEARQFWEVSVFSDISKPGTAESKDTSWTWRRCPCVDLWGFGRFSHNSLSKSPTSRGLCQELWQRHPVGRPIATVHHCSRTHMGALVGLAWCRCIHLHFPCLPPTLSSPPQPFCVVISLASQLRRLVSALICQGNKLHVNDIHS